MPNADSSVAVRIHEVTKTKPQFFSSRSSSSYFISILYKMVTTGSRVSQRSSRKPISETTATANTAASGTGTARPRRTLAKTTLPETPASTSTTPSRGTARTGSTRPTVRRDDEGPDENVHRTDEGNGINESRASMPRLEAKRGELMDAQEASYLSTTTTTSWKEVETGGNTEREMSREKSFQSDDTTVAMVNGQPYMNPNTDSENDDSDGNDSDENDDMEQQGEPTQSEDVFPATTHADENSSESYLKHPYAQESSSNHNSSSSGEEGEQAQSDSSEVSSVTSEDRKKRRRMSLNQAFSAPTSSEEPEDTSDSMMDVNGQSPAEEEDEEPSAGKAL